MALYRLRLHKQRQNVRLKTIKLDSLSITKGLVSITYDRTGSTLLAHDKAIPLIRKSGAFVVSNVGTSEITTILDASHETALLRHAGNRPKKTVRDLVGIHAQFNVRYFEQVGMIYTLMQQLTFQNVNIIEFSSTYTELIFFLEKTDLKVAFDTLYDQFM